MADLSILIKAMNEASPEIEEVNRSLGELGPAADDAEGAVSDSFGEMMDNVNMTMLGIFAAIEIGKTAFEALQTVYEATVGKTLEIAGEIEELMRVSGESPEKMSALRLEAQNAGIAFDDLYKAMENLNKNGVAATVDNLVAIADEYVKLQDPVAQATLLTENFGTAGQEIVPMLEAIAGGVGTVQDAGLLFTEEDMQSVKDFQDALSELEGSFDGIASAIGKDFTETLTITMLQIALAKTAIENFNNIDFGDFLGSMGLVIGLTEDGTVTTQELKNAIRDLGGSFGESRQEIFNTSQTWEEYTNRLQLAGYANQYVSQQQWEGVKATQALGNQTAETAEMMEVSGSNAKRAGEDIAEMNKAYVEAEKLQTQFYTSIMNLGKQYTPIMDDIAEKQARIVELNSIQDTGGYLDGVWVSAENAKEEISKLTTEIENARLAMEGLAAQAVAGIAWGQITADAQVSLEEITRYYDYLVATGIMSAEAGEQAIKDFMEYWGLWDPETKLLPLETTVDTTEADNYEPPTKQLLVQATLDNDEVLNWQPPTKTGVVNYRIGYMPVNPNDRAVGGPVTAGQQYNWQEYGYRGEVFVPSADGFVLSRADAERALARALYSGESAIDPDRIGKAVAQAMSGVTSNKKGGNVYNLTMPTSNNPADVRTAFELMEAWA